MSTSLPPPPKFTQQSPAPVTTGDWISFFRWLRNLWQSAFTTSQQTQQALAQSLVGKAQPQPRPLQDLALERLGGFRPGVHSETDSAAIAGFTPSAPRRHQDDLGAGMVFGRQQPVRHTNELGILTIPRPQPAARPDHRLVPFQVVRPQPLRTIDPLNALMVRALAAPQPQKGGRLNKYEATFSLSAAGTLTVSHGLNTTAIDYRVWDSSGFEVDPQSAQVIDANTLDLGFGAAEAGMVVVIG